MHRETPAIVLIGATGFTGRLVARTLARDDTPFVLAARDPERLQDAAEVAPGGTSAVVDVREPESVRRAIRPGDAVINTVGPFTELGETVVRACIETGAHYLDTTGEQPWMHVIHQRYDKAARDAGVSVVNAMAFEYALGDCALALAAQATVPVRADIIYSWGGTASSRGTRRTVVRMLGRRGFVRRDGRLRRQTPGARRRTVRLASGAILHAVSFQCGEIVTGPRYLSIEGIRGWLATGGWVSRLAPFLSPALPVLVPMLRPILEPVATRAPDPTEVEREASHFTIRVEIAEAGGRSSALEVQGTDPYGVTAEVAVHGARRALSPDTARGVLAPAQLVDPNRLFDALAGHGIRLLRDPGA